MKKIVVDQNKCIGCGACTLVAPKTFKLGKKGKAEVINQKAGNKKEVKSAIEGCPMMAIGFEKSNQ